MQDKQLYADFLVSINKTFGEELTLSANIGGSFNDIRSDAMSVRGGIADGTDAYPDEQVGLTNYFAIQNLSNKAKRMQEGWREQTQSVYASAELGYLPSCRNCFLIWIRIIFPSGKYAVRLRL